MATSIVVAQEIDTSTLIIRIADTGRMISLLNLTMLKKILFTLLFARGVNLPP